ncbi:major capsid protein [Amycolatopsis tucumanensis]|uniref:Phage major capsid protein n=1 Tax=Amycolatopsis tucumanensis TaxID=401106 RepID=A0ABP7JRQ8_9PSEU|nr:major capsid protein [Amycolatopsis tucumanensis]MCF6425065.1 major capsid protein [Amycolatopsis tucumanensis]
MRVTTIKQADEVLANLARSAAKYRGQYTEEAVRTLEQLAATKQEVLAQKAHLEAAQTPIRAEVIIPGQGAVKTQDALVEHVADALQRTATGMSGAPAPSRNVLMRVNTTYPEARMLQTSVPSAGIMPRIDATRSLDALTAAGGLCAPLETIYDIPVVGVADRPVRDALNRFQAEHGGIEFRRAIDASSLTAGVWTVDDDVAADAPDGARKTVQQFDCPPVETVAVRAIYSVLELANFMARFDREYAQAAVETSLIAAARVAENELLADILAGSTLVTVPKRLGAARDILAGLDQAVSYYRSRRRLAVQPPLTWIAPVWLRDEIRADIVRQQASADTAQALAEADAEIERWFAVRHVTPVWHLDGLPQQTVGALTIPAQTFPAALAGQPLPAWPTSVDTALFRTGDWLYLDGGRLDLGVVRDSELNARNRFQTFVETFEAAAFVGVESLRVVFQNLAPTGEAQAPITA